MNALRISVLSISLACGLCGVAHTQQSQPLQHAWEVQPNLGDIWVQARPLRAAFIDVEDLASSQIQQRLDAAQLICMNHDREGLQQKPRAMELLLTRLAGNEEPMLVRRTMMSAACLLDDGKYAKTLWEAAQTDREMRVVVERASMKWKVPVALELWRQTLRDQQAGPSDVALALEGLSILGSPEDQSLLVNILRLNATTPSNRILAAQALGATNTSGLIGLTDEVMSSDIADRHMLAAYLLQNHSEQAAMNPLEEIVSNGSETAKSIAATAIINQFPDRAMALAPEWLKRSDSRFRILALDALQRETNDVTLRLQATLLADPLPSVRNAARKNLEIHARNGFEATVVDCISVQLQSEAWEGLEQSIVLIAQLQDHTRCNAIFDLLQHPRPEVHMHAGWALMELAKDLEILEKIHTHCEEQTERLERGTPRPDKAETIRLSFLLEALGKNRFAPALAMLMKYVPKNEFRMGNLSRASAIWSIGQIRADDHDADLRTLLYERMKDLPPQNPENYLVRFGCLLALGQFAHPDSVETIEIYGGKRPNALGYAADWALLRIKEASDQYPR